MYREKEYLIERLKEAGFNARIHESMKSLKSSGEIRTGAVIRYDDVLTRSGSKKTYRDQEGAQHKRVKIWDRDTKLKVVIGEATEEQCEKLFTAFLEKLERGIWIDGNWVGIEVEDIEWVDGADSILKSRLAVEIIVSFKGGIYRENGYAAVEQVRIDAEKGAG